jgi:hypothetical protein
MVSLFADLALKKQIKIKMEIPSMDSSKGLAL